MIDPQSAVFRQIISGLARFSQLSIGGSQGIALQRAQALLLSHVTKQAFVQAVCDDFLIAAVISIAGVLPILILKSKKRKKADQMPAMK
jgi:DHA2 family multidrug resistance protein